MRAVGWFLGAIVVHGLGLWRGGRKGLAVLAWVLTQGCIAVPLALYANEPLSWAWAIAPTGALHALLLLSQAAWGARVARQTPVARWWSVTLFALLVFIVNAALNAGVMLQMSSFKVPSGSMRPTIVEGDQFFAMLDWERFPLERGAVVVFERGGVTYVKRVIGLPGERVAWDGESLSVSMPEAPDLFVPITTEEACDEADPGLRCFRETTFARSWNMQRTEGSHRLTGQWAVPFDTVFVMGDNRDNSEDSRAFGPVSLEAVVGPAQVIHWSWPHVSRIGRRLDGLPEKH